MAKGGSRSPDPGSAPALSAYRARGELCGSEEHGHRTRSKETCQGNGFHMRKLELEMVVSG